MGSQHRLRSGLRNLSVLGKHTAVEHTESSSRIEERLEKVGTRDVVDLFAGCKSRRDKVCAIRSSIRGQGWKAKVHIDVGVFGF
jgi:hypothetical protein